MRAPRQQRDRARSLRKNQTAAETAVWRRLRELRRSHGLHFRRQHPVGPFIADFACVKAQVLIEIDGGQHAVSTSDANCDRVLRAHGYRVLRFWNSDVFENLDGVVETIAAACRATAATGADASITTTMGAARAPLPARGEGLGVGHQQFGRTNT